MKIEDVRTTALAVPYAEQPAFAPGYDEPIHLLVVEIETKGGIVGMGYLHLLLPATRTVEACVHEVLKPRLLGRDATEIEGIWADLYRATHTVGRMGIVLFAMSAVDVALWDALGKRAGLPLFRLWGATRTEAPVYGSGCYRGLGGDGMIDKAHRYVREGFRAVKMQVAHVHTSAQDLENVRRMREALGPDIDVMIDVNQGWTADRAVQMGRRFEEYDIYWLEEPVPVDDAPGYHRIARALDLRIVGGENHTTRWDLRPFFTDPPPLPILQPDFMRGGLSEMRKIAAVADTYGIRLAPHLFPELMVHVLCSIPNGETLEHMGWLDHLWADYEGPRDGRLRPPERPGHGLALREEVLRDYRLRA